MLTAGQDREQRRSTALGLESREGHQDKVRLFFSCYQDRVVSPPGKGVRGFPCPMDPFPPQSLPELSASVPEATAGQFPVALAPSTLMLFKQLRS